MRLVILSLMAAFILSSCAVHVYHHSGDKKKAVCESYTSCQNKLCSTGQLKGNCDSFKKGKECTDCKKSPDCSSGQCPLKKTKSKSGSKSCCQS